MADTLETRFSHICVITPNFVALRQTVSAQIGSPMNLCDVRSQPSWVSLNHDGTDGSDGTGIQSVLPVPSASVAGPSVPSVSNSRSN